MEAVIIFPIDRLRYNNRFPWVNTALIVVNALIYLAITLPISLGANAASSYRNFVMEWGATPSHLTLTTVFTCMFLHDGWLHIAGNLIMLWVFGNNTERRLGPILYLLFYIATGMAGTLAFGFMNRGSDIPMIGASGAVFGVMGMYAVFFPRWKVDFVYGFPFIWNGTLHLHCFIIMGLYVAEQVLYYTLGGAESVAIEAHIGGFGLGVLAAGAMRRVAVRKSFIMKSEIEPTFEELLTPGVVGGASTQLIYGVKPDAPVAVILKKFIKLAPESLSDGMLLTQTEREELQKQCRQTNGLFFRNVNASVGRRLADSIRTKHGVGTVVIPSSDFVDLPPAVTVTDAWFGADDIHLVRSDGSLVLKLYSDVRLLAGGRLRLPDGEPFGIMQLVLANPLTRFMINERILRFDLARQHGVSGGWFQTLAAAAVKSQKIGFVNKGVIEWSEGTDSGRTTFTSLAEFDLYTLWVLNVALLVSRA